MSIDEEIPKSPLKLYENENEEEAGGKGSQRQFAFQVKN
jgi:hypothetical protein